MALARSYLHLSFETSKPLIHSLLTHEPQAQAQIFYPFHRKFTLLDFRGKAGHISWAQHEDHAKPPMRHQHLRLDPFAAGVSIHELIFLRAHLDCGMCLRTHRC